MNCREFGDALHRLFIGELDPEKKPELELHAESCARCGELMHTAHELSCKEFVEFLGEYVDDVLAPERRAVFERHLAICPECTAYLQTYRRTIDLARVTAGDADKETVEEMPADLVRAIVDSLKKR